MEIMQREWYSVNQVAEFLDVSTKTVRKQIAYGELRAHKFGRQIRVKHKDLERSLKPIRTIADARL